jgi:hypothetical protein
MDKTHIHTGGKDIQLTNHTLTPHAIADFPNTSHQIIYVSFKIHTYLHQVLQHPAYSYFFLKTYSSIVRLLSVTQVHCSPFGRTFRVPVRPSKHLGLLRAKPPLYIVLTGRPLHMCSPPTTWTQDRTLGKSADKCGNGRRKKKKNSTSKWRGYVLNNTIFRTGRWVGRQ